MRYDCIIVGSGPAGLEAAINLQIRKKSFLIFGQKGLSGKIEKAPKIDNYLGFPGITGSQMVQAFQEHLAQQQITITEERVTAMYPMGDYFAVAAKDQVYEATTVILATGVYAAKLYPGEEAFVGRGVGYCATCDAPLYKNKTVAIVGTSAEAEHEANYVAEIANKVYYIPVGYRPTILTQDVTVIEGRVQELMGTTRAEKLVLDTQEIEADGFFILRESLAPATLMPGITTSGAHIVVDAAMATNLPGCYAAGDCVGKPYQYIRAAGQGLTAAHSIVAYLALQALEKRKDGSL